MANFTAADVKALREKTGAGMMDVKKALQEAEGDAEKALEIIRLKGLKSLSKREGRQASAGLLAASVQDGVGVMVEVNSETDFVAKNQKFIDFAKSVLEAAVASGASDVDSLLAAPMGDSTVKDQLNAMAAVIGEKLEIRRVIRVEGENVDLYLHQTSPDRLRRLVSSSSPTQQVQALPTISRCTSPLTCPPTSIATRFLPMSLTRSAQPSRRSPLRKASPSTSFRRSFRDASKRSTRTTAWSIRHLPAILQSPSDRSCARLVQRSPSSCASTSAPDFA